PGTKWCGAGNIADSHSDLGHHRMTDACCRTHDRCPHSIPPLQVSKTYNYFNFRPYSISHCKCDQAFYACLASVGSNAAKDVGKVFFNILKVPCFI
ncbi:predicted protein, partial [Nematostella vectensis]